MVTQNKTPGMPCPECRFNIQLSIRELLYEAQFQCPGCGLRLFMDRGRSRGSLEALQQLNIAMVNVEKAKRQSR